MIDNPFIPESQRQTCKHCGRPDKFNFHVPDDVWESIVPQMFQNNVLCLYCFDNFAVFAGIDYTHSLQSVYFAGNAACFELAVN